MQGRDRDTAGRAPLRSWGRLIVETLFDRDRFGFIGGGSRAGVLGLRFARPGLRWTHAATAATAATPAAGSLLKVLFFSRGRRGSSLRFGGGLDLTGRLAATGALVDAFDGLRFFGRTRAGVSEFAAPACFVTAIAAVGRLLKFVGVFLLFEEVGDVQEGVALQANIDERGLHAREHAGDPAFVDRAG
jgi:hypothetical protein